MRGKLSIEIEIHEPEFLKALAHERVKAAWDWDWEFEDEGEALWECLIASNLDPLSPIDMGIEIISSDWEVV